MREIDRLPEADDDDVSFNANDFNIDELDIDEFIEQEVPKKKRVEEPVEHDTLEAMVQESKNQFVTQESNELSNPPRENQPATHLDDPKTPVI